jgi:hypothetical protein
MTLLHKLLQGIGAYVLMFIVLPVILAIANEF